MRWYPQHALSAGRIIAVHLDSVGLVRNATLWTTMGVCKRAIQKLIKLPVDD